MKEKNILVWYGSPHPNGHTRMLLDSFLACFREEGYHIDELDAYAQGILPCTACGACARQEGCLFDDLDPWDARLRASSLLVVASPVYNLSFPAPLKAVVDRCQRYFEARFALGLRPPIERHRPAVLLAASGSGDTEGQAFMARQLSVAFSVMNTTLTHTVALLDTDEGGSFESARQQAMDAALAIKCEL